MEFFVRRSYLDYRDIPEWKGDHQDRKLRPQIVDHHIEAATPSPLSQRQRWKGISIRFEGYGHL
jgi:hypothetical protein